MATTQQLKKRLKSIQTAIARIESGAQSATVSDMTWSEADISKLYEQESDLEKRIARADGRRPFTTDINMTGLC